MRIHWLQHVDFEGLGSIEAWAQQQGHHLSYSRLFADDPLPAPDSYDWLIVMGGPMSVNDEAAYPWLKAEKQAIRAAIDAGKVVLGICLGAQLIASVLGAKVAPNDEKEIGWFDVKLTQNAALSPFFVDFTDSFSAFHWHGECFELPRRALRMARSEHCDQQAFVYDERVVGLQFHLETTSASAVSLIEHCADELEEHGPAIQSASQMLAEPEKFSALNGWMDALLGRMEAVALRKMGK